MAVLAAVGGSALLFPPGGGAGASGGGEVPEGRRLLGIGHAAIAIPEAWGTNEVSCYVPQADTVVIDLGPDCLAGTARPAGVESVEVRPGGSPWVNVVFSDAEVAGERARRTATTCSDGVDGELCWAAVQLPGHDVEFIAESSTGAAEVDEILSWIRIVDDRIAVPGHEAIAIEKQEDAIQAAYLEAVRDAGLTAQVVQKKVAGRAAGYVLDVVPGPGTMLSRGEPVTVTVSAPPEGPADEVMVEIFFDAPGGNDGYLSDPDVQAGATIILGLGDTVWVHASGAREETFAAADDGDSLQRRDRDEIPPHSHSWKAIRPGTTTVTLTITADGEPVRLGTVTVVVR